MKEGKSLQEVLVTLQDQEKAKRDFITPAAGLSMEEDGKTVKLTHLTTGETELFTPNPLFHQQLATATGIPAKYYNTMLARKPELLAANINSWLPDNPRNYMVRSFDYNGTRTARALLSERYRRIDNLQIAAAVLPLFAGSDNFKVISCDVTDNHLYLKILNNRLFADVTPGDTVQAGVMISNSEVGLGAVTVKPLVYRLVCTNGMIADMGTKAKHLGRKTFAVEDSFDLYSDETIEAEDSAFLLKLRDVTMAAIDEARFGQVVDRLRESKEQKITGKVQEVVNLTGKVLNITTTETDLCLKYLIEGGDLSKWGLANSLTRASQDIESYDRATDFEGFGWDVVTMTDNQWAAINEK